MTLPHELDPLRNAAGIYTKAARSYTNCLAVCRWRYVTDASGFRGALPLASPRLRPERPQLPRAATNKRLLHDSKKASYSITSSAVASSVVGTARPSALAVLRLMAR